MEMPTIDVVNRNNNRPIISGTFDSIFSKQLRVIFGERSYTLGIDNELTSMEAGGWVLDLSTLAQPLVPDAYELIAEAEGYDGQVRRAETILILVPIAVSTEKPSVNELPQDTPTEKPSIYRSEENIPRPMAQEEARSKVSRVPLLLTLSSTFVFAAFGLVLYWKR